MKQSFSSLSFSIAVVALCASATIAAAQQPATSNQDPAAMSSSKPAQGAPAQMAPVQASAPTSSLAKTLGLHVYPAQKQSLDQQRQDQSACYDWAKQDTGFDPIASAAAQQNGQQQTAPKGMAMRGAAGGAATGAVIGAVAGDAAKGAAAGAAGGALRGRVAQRMAAMQAQQREAAVEQRQQATIGSFKKAFTACMEARGYSVE